MAITVTDNRVSAGLIDRADSTTGWSSPVGGEGATLFTADPPPKETTGHIGVKVSNAEIEMLHTHGSGADLSSGVLVYIWAFGQGVMDDTATYGISAVLGDGTNTNAYQVAGSDVAVFRHGEGSNVNYQCLLVDTGSLPTGKALQGTFGSFDNTAVTEYGVNFTTTVKSVGGVENCYVDQIIYGNGGLTIIGTETTTLLDDLSALDASSTSDGSYGICRDIGGGVFGIQGQLLLGDTTSGTDTLSITNQSFNFENFSGIGTDKLGLTWQGGSGTQTFVIDNSTIFCPAGTGAFFTATETDIESLDATNNNFLNIDQSFDLTTDVTNGPNWDWSNNKFVGCSQIDIGKTAFVDNVINSTTDATGGMLISSTTSLSNVSGLSFISDGTGHAIYITAAGTYSFIDFTFSGYSTASLGSNLVSSTGSTDAMIYNNSSGAVTINISGGDNVSVRNGASATTTVNANQSVDVHVQDTSTAAVQNAVVAIYDSSDDSELVNELTDVSGDISTASIANGTDIYIRVRKSTSGIRYYPVETVASVSGDVSLTITLNEDAIVT